MEQEEGDAEVIEQLLKNRSAEDLRWEFDKLSGMLAGSLYDAEPASSKTQALLGYVDQRPDPTRPGRVRQTVIFTQFWDTPGGSRPAPATGGCPAVGWHLFRRRGGQYTHPETGKLVGTERDEIKHRFLRGQIDILVCTDAAGRGPEPSDSGLSGQLRFALEPRQRSSSASAASTASANCTRDIYVQNLCYLGSVEEIVYDRLLNRLGSMIAVVGRPAGLDVAGHRGGFSPAGRGRGERGPNWRPRRASGLH
jgi:hypothetical protein